MRGAPVICVRRRGTSGVKAGSMALRGQSTARLDQSLTSRSRRYAAEPSLARVEFLHCCGEVHRREVRPTPLGEVKLGIRALPQQEVAEALLAPGSNEKIDIRALTFPVIDLAHRTGELFARHVLLPIQEVGGPDKRVAG